MYSVICVLWQAISMGLCFLLPTNSMGMKFITEKVIESNSIYVPNAKCTKYFNALVKNLPKTMTTIFILIGN